MRGNSLVTCVDEERRDGFFDDLYDSVTPVPRCFFHDQITLPAFVPGINEGLVEELTIGPSPLVAISLQTFLRKSGAVRFHSADDLKRTLRLPKDARLALIGTGKDYKLERFWTKSDRLNVWGRIADFGFEFVTSPTFPVYDENPRADQIYNQDRGLLASDLLATLGVPSVPFFYPYNDEDHLDALSWLKARQDIFRIAMLAQFYRTEAQFRQFQRNMRLIRDGADRPVEFLIVGVARRDRLEALIREFNATIISWKPFNCAVFGGLGLDVDLADMSHYKFADMSRGVLAAENIHKFSVVCEELRRCVRRVIAQTVV